MMLTHLCMFLKVSVNDALAIVAHETCWMVEGILCSLVGTNAQRLVASGTRRILRNIKEERQCSSKISRIHFICSEAPTDKTSVPAVRPSGDGWSSYGSSVCRLLSCIRQR